MKKTLSLCLAVILTAGIITSPVSNNYNSEGLASAVITVHFSQASVKRTYDIQSADSVYRFLSLHLVFCSVKPFPAPLLLHLQDPGNYHVCIVRSHMQRDRLGKSTAEKFSIAEFA